jgi:hypothetical protein
LLHITKKWENCTKKQELTYEIIRDAVNGDEEAEDIILDYYEPYIIKLSKLPYINEEGNVAYVIDEDIYMSLKLKLHELIINFKVA